MPLLSGEQAQAAPKFTRLMGRVGRAVVGQQLGRVPRPPAASAHAVLQRLGHQVARPLPGEAPGGGDEAHGLAVSASQGESHLDARLIPTVNLEGIRAPARVALEGGHGALMGARQLASVARQQQARSRHPPLGFTRGLPSEANCRFTRAVIRRYPELARSIENRS